MNAISCLAWVKRGIASSNPEKVTLNEAKLKQFVSHHGHDSENEADNAPSNEKRKKSKKSTINVEDERIVESYDLDNYSDDEKESDDESDGSLGMSNLTFFTKNEEDPYITKNDDDSEDDEDMIISSDDNLILAGKVDGDFSSLEVWVYNEKLGNDGLFCHHEYILPSLPLTVEYVGGVEGKNLAAVGGFDASLSLWDLDVMDTLDPHYLVKGWKPKKSLKSKAKKTKSESEVQKEHSDAILDLSWNELQTNILASASVDKTIGLWDLNSLPQCCFLNGFHSEKVQTLQWHPCEAQTLLSGSSDKTVKVFDCRATQSSAKSWGLSGEVEKVLWHSSSPFCFFSGVSTGFISYIDIRMTEPVYQLDAHSPGSVTDLAICNSSSGNCLLSSSEKGVVKVWDISKENKLVNTKNYKIGSVFCLSACPDSAKPIFAMGGENEMKVSNLTRDVASAESFGWTYEGRLKTSDTMDNKKTKRSKIKKDKAAAGSSANPQTEADEERQARTEKKRAKARMAEKKKVLKSKVGRKEC